MKTAEEILIKYETYINQNHTPIVYRDHALKAMEEYASQFKTVEKRAELLKEIMDTDQEHGMYENECEHDETPRQGDGFTYFVCSKCGASV